MYKRHSKVVPLYPRTIDFVCSTSLKKFRKDYHFEEEIDDSIAHFCTTNLKYQKNKDYRVVIFLSKNDKLTHGILAHEALHAANSILDDIGYKFNPDDDEPICYLLTWIIDEAYKFIKDINLKIS